MILSQNVIWLKSIYALSLNRQPVKCKIRNLQLVSVGERFIILKCLNFYFLLWFLSVSLWSFPMRRLMLYCHLLIHVDIYIYICWIHTDATNKDTGRKTQEDFFNNILPLTLLQGFERVVQGLHVRGSWRPNMNCNFLTPLLWPSRCVFLVLLMLGSTPSGFPRAPSVGCGFSYHIWSLAVWNSTGNCFLDSNST